MLFILSTRLTKISSVIWTCTSAHLHANNNLILAVWIWLSAESTGSPRIWIFSNQNGTELPIFQSELLTLAKLLSNHCRKHKHHHDLSLFQRYVALLMIGSAEEPSAYASKALKSFMNLVPSSWSSRWEKFTPGESYNVHTSRCRY